MHNRKLRADRADHLVDHNRGQHHGRHHFPVSLKAPVDRQRDADRQTGLSHQAKPQKTLHGRFELQSPRSPRSPQKFSGGSRDEVENSEGTHRTDQPNVEVRTGDDEEDRVKRWISAGERGKHALAAGRKIGHGCTHRKTRDKR